MADTKSFHYYWCRAVKDANRLFQTSFDFGTSAASGTVLGNALFRSRDLFLQGGEALSESAALLAQISHLLWNLSYIEEKRPSSFKRYQTRLIGGLNDTGTFMGEKAEVTVEVALLNSGLPYCRNEPPDFWVTVGAARVAVEITSARIYSSPVDEGDKAVQKLIDKDKKYRSNDWHRSGPSILFVDVTNLKVRLHGMNLPPESGLDLVEEALLEAISGTYFDCVFLFWEIHLLGVNCSGFQGRFIKSGTRRPETTAFIEKIDALQAEEAGLNHRGGFFSPDL